MKDRLTVALAGNPNSGKTTLFNQMTGSRQHVGNYPGVTVERKEGTCYIGDAEIHIIDLPGTYSLTAYSPEERVARDFIIHEKPDVVIDVVDASNLERNVYLALQIMELGAPVVLAFNMSDVARARGMAFDLDILSNLLGAPIVPTVGHRNVGVGELLAAAVRVARAPGPIQAPRIYYGRDVEQAIEAIEAELKRIITFDDEREARWTALKLLENDLEVMKRISSPHALERAQKERQRIASLLGETAEMIIADGRYGFISGACRQAVRSTCESRHSHSDRMDEIIIHRVWGLPIFLGLMYLVFWLTFTLGAAPVAWMESMFRWLGDAAAGLWPSGTDSMLKSLLVDGILAGVGGVLVFTPNILMLFLAIAMLEDSGYMARAAFLMDRLMHKIGLHGKSFIPMLIGFGCSVPAIMATRTLESRQDRLTTMLVIPLISCGARLPIYTLMIAAFFSPAWHAPMLWVMYITGILLAIGCAKLLRSTLFRGDAVPFVMELPPYRVPTCKATLMHMWERAWLYLKKAGTIILALSVVLWVLTSFPRGAPKEGMTPEEQQAHGLSGTIAGRIGHALEPPLKLMGFDWRIGTALIGAFGAKEIFVAQLAIVHSLGEADSESVPLREKLRAHYSPLTGFCIMLFCLVSAPCLATIAVTKRESNSWRWALFQLGGLTLLAYGLTVIVYQTGRIISALTG